MDIAIFAGIRNERVKFYQDFYNYSYVLKGSPDDESMPILKDIPYNYRVTHLELDNVEVNPQLLFRKLVPYAVGPIKTIKLINVTWLGTMETQDEILLPGIKEFILEVNHRIGPNELLRLRNKNCSVNVDDVTVLFPTLFSNFQDKSCLRPFVFFHNSKVPNNWDFNQIYQMGVKIDLIIFGSYIFKINPEDGELISLLNYTNEILDNIQKDNYGFELRKLHLRGIPIKVSTLKAFAPKLTHLTLHIVSYLDEEEVQNSTTTIINQQHQPANFFQQFSSLEYLDLKSIAFGTKLQKIDLNSFSTTILQDLSLSNVQLTLNNNNGSNLPSFNLNRLHFYSIGIENIQIIEKFHEIFNNTKIFIWDGKNNIGPIVFSRYELWLNVMKIDSLDVIMFGKSSITSTNTKGKMEALQLLTRLNLQPLQLQKTFNLDQDFIMRRDPITKQWIGGTVFDESGKLSDPELYNYRIGINTFLTLDTYLLHLKLEKDRKKLYCGLNSTYSLM